MNVTSPQQNALLTPRGNASFASTTKTTDKAASIHEPGNQVETFQPSEPGNNLLTPPFVTGVKRFATVAAGVGAGVAAFTGATATGPAAVVAAVTTGAGATGVVGASLGFIKDIFGGGLISGKDETAKFTKIGLAVGATLGLGVGMATLPASVGVGLGLAAGAATLFVGEAATQWTTSREPERGEGGTSPMNGLTSHQDVSV